MKLLGVKEVQKATGGTSETYAYKLIRKLNEELKEKGYLTIRGKVPEKYFLERFYG